MKTWQLALSIILFNFTWISASLLHEWLAAIGLLGLGMTLRFSHASRKKIIVGGVFAMVSGILMDMILQYFGVYNFPDTYLLIYTPLPIWLIIMWAAFSTTLFSSFYWALNKPAIFIVLCALLGPASYMIGRNIGIIDFNNTHGFIMILGWALWASIFLEFWHKSIKKYVD